MSYHNDICLKLSLKTGKEAKELFKSFVFTDKMFSLDFNNFCIDANDSGSFDVDKNTICLHGQTGYREIDSKNVEDFFEFIKSLYPNVQDIYLQFIPQESDKPFIVFTTSISKKALKSLCEENELKPSQFKNVVWCIYADGYNLESMVFHDEDDQGREEMYEFEEELVTWTKDVMEEWKFPESWMNVQAIKNKEILWENE